MSLITANKNDIVIGEPLPWPLYDQEQNILIERGGIVRNKEHMDELLTQGACRELSWESIDETNNAAGNSTVDQSKANETTTHFTFDDMKLKVESRLQLEPAAQLSHEQYFVKVIGFLRGASLLVTIPSAANGKKPELKEGLKASLRSFSGQNAFGFTCTLLRIIKSPYEYLHLSFPDKIQGIMIRKAIRIKARIITAVQNPASLIAGQQMTALISNISADGAALDAKRSLGKKNDILDLSFRVNLHKIDAYLTIKGIIRSVLSDEATQDPDIYHYGIEFKDLQPNDMVILQSMIYQKMVESPNQLM